MKKNSVKPRSLMWRRWQDGNVIGLTRLDPEFSEFFGAPYYVTHRAHLHQVLHEKVIELDVPVFVESKVTEYQLEGQEVAIILESGERLTADLIVAADGTFVRNAISTWIWWRELERIRAYASRTGVKSTARKYLLGDLDKGPQTYGLAAFRATISVADIRANPVTAWVAESQSLNLW
jgi:salicylate hydroxylase